MRMNDLIQKKRDGKALSKSEINYIIQGCVDESIPDYQLSALSMAIYFQGMNDEETASLTLEMAQSGEVMDLTPIKGTTVDKHSTGGVGDTTTLILAPLVASCGVPVAKVSGRGLGHTGGTLDKLESFNGFSVELSKSEFIRQVNEHKIAVIGQSGEITPADKKLYALRDVTATVDSIPLIASSIMSKKIATGADAIVLDVKMGSGAFMTDKDEAKKLAEAMVNIGHQLNRKTTAIISNMDQPLGNAIGNSLEVIEAIETLQGKGPKDLEELCLVLGSHMVYLAGITESIEDAKVLLKQKIANGEALDMLRLFISLQGGDEKQVMNPSLLPHAKKQVEVFSEVEGYVHQIDALKIGVLSSKMGAGRVTKDATIDLAVGVVLHKKVGSYVQKGESLATLHLNENNEHEFEQQLQNAYHIEKSNIEDNPLIIAEITTN